MQSTLSFTPATVCVTKQGLLKEARARLCDSRLRFSWRKSAPTLMTWRPLVFDQSSPYSYVFWIFCSGWPKESSPRLSKLSPVPLKLGVPKSSGSLDAQDFCVPGLYSSFPEPWRSVTMRSHLTLSNLSFDPSGQLTCTASISVWSPKPKWTRTSFALR